MRKVIKKIYSGAVCEYEIYNISERARDIRKAAPKLRFKTEYERKEHRAGISRRNHARLVNANFTPQSLYSTLTMDNDNEVHTFSEARKMRDNFVRRLKYAYPNAVIFIYMGRGKNTQRIHFHMISDGVPAPAIAKRWKYGEVLRIENLRENNYYKGKACGRDYTGLANYLFDHWTEEQGGHRWKQTRNTKRPQETIKEIRREYTQYKPPRTPKGYIMTAANSTSYGYLYFRYALEPPKRKRKQCTA